MNSPRRTPAVARVDVGARGIALGYALVGLAWIVVSGMVLRSESFDPGLANALEIVKGVGYVGITSGALYLLLRRRSATIAAAHEQERTASDRLHSAEDLLRGLVESAPLPILTLDRQSRVTSWNPASERVLGWSADEVIGGPLPFVGPEEEPESAKIRARVLAGEAIHGLEVHRHRKDGSPIVMRLWLAPMRDTDGAITGFLSINEDITAQQAAEEERTRLAAAVEQASEAIVITDADASIVYVNPAFEATSGYSRGELIGRNSRMLQSGRQGPEFYRQMWETLGRGEAWSGTFVNKRKDGTLYEEDEVITPLRDQGGAIRYFVGVKRDVTREHALERQVADAQRMEAVGQLAGGVAHDFNNLLTAISGYAQLLSDELGPSDHRQADADAIVRASGSAAALVRQLLAFGRRQILQPEVVDIRSLVDGLLPMLRRLLGDAIAVESPREPVLDSVLIDPGQFEQVLVNLAVNARDAMPDGGTFTIAVDGVTIARDSDPSEAPPRPGRYVRIAVRDTGTGMDPETRARVFEPFFTTKPVGSGSGLGLATAYGIVKAFSGYIYVASEPGSGSTFTIYLPHTDQPLPARPAESPRSEGARGGGETILVVEDETGVRQFAVAALSRLGYRVLAAVDGREALDVAGREDGSIELLLTDVTLPGVAGPQVAAALSATRPTLGVLYMSGYTEDEYVRRGVGGPGVAFLAKPFTVDQLARRVRELLDARGGARPG